MSAPHAASPFRVADMNDAIAGADYVFICGGLRIRSQDERHYLATLRKAARSGARVGSLSTGTYLLARAGLLDGYRCTIHWGESSGLPGRVFRHRLHRQDLRGRPRPTHLFGRHRGDGPRPASDRGSDMAPNSQGASRTNSHHDRIRGESDDQRGGRSTSLAHLPPSVRRAVELMRGSIEEPLPMPLIARRVGVSGRQLERLFLRFLDRTPLRYYLELRLERAREILLLFRQVHYRDRGGRSASLRRPISPAGTSASMVCAPRRHARQMCRIDLQPARMCRNRQRTRRKSDARQL